MASTISSEDATGRWLLVVAKPAGAPELRRLRDLAPGRQLELRVVAPAFVRSRLQFLASDVDEGIRLAQGRLEQSLAEIEADSELRGDGEVGEADPILAIDSALLGFDADQIVIIPSDGRRLWAEKRLAVQADERFPVPVREIEPAA
jgi:hypothetical protein